MEIGRLRERIFCLNEEIGSILTECAYSKQYDLTVDYDAENAEEGMMYHEFSSIFTHLDYINYVVEYMKKPFVGEGIIELDGTDTYRLNGVRLRRNETIEILRTEPEVYWDVVAVSDIYKLEGVRARLRGKKQ